MDPVGGGKRVSKPDFYIGLKDFGLNVSKEESDALEVYLDKEKLGFIDFNEFLAGIRGALNPARKAIVDKAFGKLDRTGGGIVTVDDIRGVYSAKKHPKVISGEKTEDQIFKEFLVTFGDKDADGQLTREEFEEYYANLSASVDSDEEFQEILIHAWKL